MWWLSVNNLIQLVILILHVLQQKAETNGKHIINSIMYNGFIVLTTFPKSRGTTLNHIFSHQQNSETT